MHKWRASLLRHIRLPSSFLLSPSGGAWKSDRLGGDTGCGRGLQQGLVGAHHVAAILSGLGGGSQAPDSSEACEGASQSGGTSLGEKLQKIRLCLGRTWTIFSTATPETNSLLDFKCWAAAEAETAAAKVNIYLYIYKKKGAEMNAKRKKLSKSSSSATKKGHLKVWPRARYKIAHCYYSPFCTVVLFLCASEQSFTNSAKY